MNNLIIHEQKLAFCNVTIFNDYVYVVMNEGITVLPEYNDILIGLSDKYLKGANFVYITHRLNSYSVNPTIYLETSKIENLKAFAVVTTETLESSSIEKLFFSKPFGIFNELSAALEWKDKILYED